MKRQELVQVHALLWEVRGFLETAGLVSTDAFRSYDAQSVRPAHVHRQKTDHHRAISLLLDGFEAPSPSAGLTGTAKRSFTGAEEIASSTVRPLREHQRHGVPDAPHPREKPSPVRR